MKDDLEMLKDKITKVWRSKKFDPNGSYTGNSIEKTQPVQDQDDL